MFLKTIRFVGDDLLIRISHIKFIYTKGTQNGSQIVIVTEDNQTYTEGFTDDKKLSTRYNQIKEIIGGR